MNCSKVQEILSAYYDGELADEQLLSLAEHLDGCLGCAKELTAFEKLSNMASALRRRVPPEDIWNQLEQQLDQESSDEQPTAARATQTRRWSFFEPRLYVLAATVLVVAGIGISAYQTWYPTLEGKGFSTDFGHYLEQFHRDPDAAQRILLANYENQLVAPDQAIQRVGYRPAVADGLPEAYTLESTHVVKMSCCTCVQSICKRSDGSTLAIFEHDDDEDATTWFGDWPEITAICNEKQCCLVELDERIAASWKRGKRRITIIGARDVAEVSQMVGWLDKKKHLLRN